MGNAFEELEKAKQKRSEVGVEEKRNLEATAKCFYLVLEANPEFHSRLRVMLEAEAPTDFREGEIAERVVNGRREAWAVIQQQYRRGERLLAEIGDLP